MCLSSQLYTTRLRTVDSVFFFFYPRQESREDRRGKGTSRTASVVRGNKSGPTTVGYALEPASTSQNLVRQITITLSHHLHHTSTILGKLCHAPGQQIHTFLSRLPAPFMQIPVVLGGTHPLPPHVYALHVREDPSGVCGCMPYLMIRSRSTMIIISIVAMGHLFDMDSSYFLAYSCPDAPTPALSLPIILHLSILRH